MRLPHISAALSHLQPGHIAHVLFFLAIVGLAVLYALPDGQPPATIPQTPTAAPEPVKSPTEPQAPAESQEPDTEVQPTTPIQVVAPPPRKEPAVADEPEARAVEPEAAESKATVPAPSRSPSRCYPRCRPWWRCR